MAARHRRRPTAGRRLAMSLVGVGSTALTLVLITGVVLVVAGNLADDRRALPQADAATPRASNAGAPASRRPVSSLVATATPAALPSALSPVSPLSSSVVAPVETGSLLRLQQLLAELHYLPVTFTPTTADTDPAAQATLALDPPAGEFAMQYAGTPAALARLWQPGVMTPMTQGAVMAFESAHALKPDGVAGPAVWSALVHDAASGATDPKPYTWIWTTMSRPETLRVWQNGAFVFSSRANTGVPAAPTPQGSWPVYARYRSQTMQGTNPDGSHYRDAGVPYVNYFHGGDAVHGFSRRSYGSQQSLGCVELPYSAAAQVWNLVGYGTVVTVTR